MSRITGVIVALATTAAVLTGSTVGRRPAACPRRAPLELACRELEGGVELTLADGDLLRVSAPRRTTARCGAERRDAATGDVGSAPVGAAARKNLFCGDVDARTANGAVAAHREVRPLQLLRGPGPRRLARAVVGRHGDLVVVRARGRGLRGAGHLPRRQQRDLAAARRLRRPHRGRDSRATAWTRAAWSTPATATITDQEQVSYLFGAQTGRRCALVVLTRNGAADAGPTGGSSIAAPAGTSPSPTSTQDTVWLGDLTAPRSARSSPAPTPSSPWAVTQVAPAGAPGLQRAGRRLTSASSRPRRLPLISLGAPDRRRCRAQLYDPVSQTWGADRFSRTTPVRAGAGGATTGSPSRSR